MRVHLPSGVSGLRGLDLGEDVVLPRDAGQVDVVRLGVVLQLVDGHLRDVLGLLALGRLGFRLGLVVDRQQLGGMADEDIQSPGYAKSNGIEVKTNRLVGSDDRDGYRVRARRVTVPVVLEPSAGVRITGTGI